MTRLVRPAPATLIVALVLAMFLAGAMSLLPAGPVHAQGVLPTITVEAVERPGETGVPVDATALFRLKRSGDLSGDLSVRLQTRNTHGLVGFGVDPTLIVQFVRMPPNVTQVDVRVWAQRGNRVLGEMQAQVFDGSGYQQGDGTTNRASVAVREPTDDDIIVFIAADEPSIEEGGDAVFRVSRSGRGTSSLTVPVEVEDPDGAMQGNHWDPAPADAERLKSVTIPAGQSSATVSFPTRPNVRDTGDLTLMASMVEDEDSTYWVSYNFRAGVTVTDDDTAMEVSLSVDRENILEGESITFTFTRHGDASEALEDAPFHLRIGPDIRRYLWPEYEEPQDYAVTMAAGESARELSFKVHYDGYYWRLGDTHRRNFRFRAEIRPASGIPEEHLDEYVSVRGDRRVEAIVTNQAKQTVTFVSVGSGFEGEDYDNGHSLSELFFEGQRVPFVMERSGPAAQIAKELTVHVKYVEPYHPDRRGYLLTPSYYNPSQQSIFVTFAAGQTRANGEFFVAVDDVVEGVGIGRDNFLFLWASNVPLGDYYSDYSGYSIVGRIFTGRFVYAYIGERSLVSIAAVDDSPTIDFGEDPGSDLPSTGVTIEEGEDAEFVLTRTGLKDYEITVSVSIDDPGHFRRGDHWRNTPDRTVPVTFAAGEDTAYLTVHTSDDGRDIPDNTLTATVLPSQDDSYTPVEAGERRTSATVTVTDNDVAPEIRLSVSSSTVEEGQEAYFDIVRSGDSQDYRDFPLLFGLQGEQAFRVYTLGPGENLARRFLRTEDDDYDDPDETVYEMTLLPLENVPEDEQSQYRTIVGPSSITITVTDNDLPLVGVEQVEESYVEGELGQLRIVRMGQTGSPLNVKARVTQTGNSYFERYQYLLNVALTYTIDASEDSEVSSFQLQWEDGHEPEGSMTMQLVPGDGYRIDPERSIASFRVIEDDPAPTLAVTGATVSEDAGKIRFRVSLSSSVSPPSLQTVTVDYVTEDGTAEAGEDYTHIAGTLVIGPEKTSGVIDVPVLDNRLTEETESFSLVLSDPVNAELQDDQAKLTAVATITDNEPHVTVAPVDAEVDEGSPMRFRFTRSGDNIDLSESLTVYFLAGYEDVPPEWLEVVIPADRNSVTWQKTTEDDDYDGPDLTYLVLTIPSTWRGLPQYYSDESGSVSVTVRDNDLPMVTIEAVHEGRTEGDSVKFTLSREGQLHQPLTVNFSVAQTSDSETEQADFIAGTPPSTATFAADSATATLTVRTSIDSVAEPHATITTSIIDEEEDGYRAGDPGSASVRMIDDDRDYTTSLSISAQAGVVEEGNAAVFVVRRTGGTNLDLVARVRVTEVKRVPGSAPTDHNPLVYSVTEREVSFNPGNVTTTLEVSTEDENLNDGNSRIKASLLPGRFYGINPYPSIANIWVRDNDIPTVSFAVAHIDHVETPGQFPQFTLVRTGDASYRLDVYVVKGFVSRLGPPYGDKEVQLGVVPLPIIVGEPETTYSAEPELVGPRGAQSTVTIELFYCEEVPGDCGYNGQYRVGEISTFTATVHNSDQGVIVEADQESVNEGEPVTFTLTRVGGTPGARHLPLTVQVAVTQDGEFIQGVTPQTVRFAGDASVAGLGRPTAAVTIETVDDDVYESDGSITLTILLAAERLLNFFYEVGDGGGPQNTMATVDVVSDDDPAVSIADAEASEAGGSLTFTVDMPAVHEEVTVDWATSDGAGSESATANRDYTAATGTLRFIQGETSKTISIEILDDGVPEPDETFTVTLSNPAGVALGRAAATGTIMDDDPETLPVVTLWTRHGNVEEGEPATFDFRRQPAGGGPVSEHDGFGASPLTLNLNLTETGDFIREALENYAGVKIEYTPGSSTATVTIPATHLYFFAEFSTDDDGQTEDNGSITLALAEGPGYTIGEENEATVNVRDNDLSISIADPERHSEDATGMGFTITLSKASDQQVSVDVTTVDGTATSDDAVTAASLGKDFEARRGTFIFAPGETEKVFTVTLVDDTFDEGEESFTVELSNPSGNVSLQDASATGTISDNDMTMIVGVYREAKIVNEDAEGQVEFRFELTAAEGSGTTASEKMSTVRWTVAEGAATAGEDYEAVEASVRTQIEPGVLSKKVGVTLLDDEVYEDEYETFTFDLKGAVRLEVDGDNQSIEISLRDNETMRAVVAADSENVAEGGTASFTVSLMPYENAVPVEIEYAVVGTAGPADYTAPSGTLTIRAGETSGRVAIPVLMDTLHDPDETLGILLTRVAGGGREIALLTDTLATVTILDAGSLSASLASGASAAEGDGIEFTIELPLPTDMPVLVEWATSDAQGEQAADSMGVDYTDASGTVTIPAGDTSGTFTVWTVEDILVEGDETFTVVLRSAKKGDDPATSTDVTMAIRSVTATILDDDTAPASITLTATPDRVDEDAGETDLAVTATLDGSTRLEDDVSVELSLKGSVAAQEDDSQPASVILTIPAGQASGTATVAMTPANDEIAGGDTRVRIAGSASGFDVTRATVSITDDDEPPTGVILTVSKASVSEGADTTTITVTGTLTGGDRLSGDTTIPLSVHGISLPAAEENGEPTIAATNDDYTAAGVTLAIPAGGASGTATLEFTPTDDNLVEGDETVQVSGISEEFEVTPAVLTIEDDDREPDGIELSATPGGVTEDDGEVQVQVTAMLTGGGTRTSATAVTLSVYDVSAMAGADYIAASGILLIIPAGQVSGMASLSVTLVDDDIYEGTETVAIRGSNEDPGLSVRGVRISIADDEEKPTEIRLVLDRDTIAEGGGSQQLRVTAIVQGDSKRAVSTQISLSFGAPTTESSAGPSTPRSSTRSSTTRSSIRSSETGPTGGPPATATDYSALVNTITIPAGESAGEVLVLVSPIDDPIAEGDERLEIRGSTPGLKVSSALVTITDNDDRGIVLSKTTLTVEEEDADGETYTVKLATQPTVEVTVTVTGQDQTDLELTGLSPTSTLSFDAVSWNDAQTVTVKAREDTDAANDKVTLVHTAAGGEYAGAKSDLAVTVDDDETVSIVLSESSLTVVEGDSTGQTYTVKLSHQPSREVTVTVTGQDTTDLELTGLGEGDTLSFTTSSWSDAQTVTVKADQDGDGSDDKVTLTHTATGGEYAGTTADVAVTVTDDETLGVVISPTAIAVQAGGSNTYSVVLGSQPAGDVTVSLAGHEGAVLSLTGIDNDNALTFTQDNWNAEQTVSVSADAAAQSSTITIGHSVSSADDPEYDGATAADVGVSVLEAPSTIQIQLGVTTSEQELEVPEGGSKTYTIVLSHQPSGDVTVTVNNPTDNLEVTATPRSLTFTTENWDEPQAVTVAAVQDTDALDDSATVTHGVSGGGYGDVSAPDVAVTVTDDETLGVVISPTAIAVQAGGSNTYTVVLGSLPSGDVTVTVSGQAGTDLSLGGLSPTNTLTFGTGNWNTGREVAVGAAEDAGAGEVTLSHGVSSADDPEYAALEADDVVVTVIPMTPDTPILQLGVAVSDLKLTVPEGGSKTYTIVLSHQPSGDVTVTVNNPTDNLEVTATPRSLTFTTENWDEPQAVTVAAVQDTDALDDSATVTHGVSGGGYGDVSAPDVAVTVTDDDRGIVLDPTTLTVVEGDATGQSYTVKLAAQPTVEVTVTVTGQDQTDLELTGLSPTNTLTFDATSWSDAQTVTVKADQDGDGSDDKVTLTHTATGGEYAGTTADVAVTVTDDETLGVVISPTAIAVQAGGSNTYSVVLGSQPAGDVTVSLAGHEGAVLSLTGIDNDNALTFTQDNWNAEQTVSVSADAAAQSSTITIGHSVSSADDPEYDGATAADVGVSVLEAPSTIQIQLGVTTSEQELEVPEGGSKTYTIVLSHQPSGDVTVTVNNPTDNLEVTATPRSLTFTTENWDEPQAVTVAAVQDTDALDDSATVTHGVSGGGYGDVSAPDVAVTVTDDETLGVVISPTAIAVQAGGSNTYTVVLGSLPSGDVTVTLAGHEGAVLSLAGIDNGNALTFSQDNWHAPQTVSVSADAEAQSSTITIEHSVASADDPDYAAAAAPDVAVSVLGAPDTIQIQVGVATSVQELEVPEGGANTYSMVLSHQPSGDVTVTVNNPTDNSEVTATPRTLTFTTENWHAPQTVTVSAAHDGDAADDSATVTHGVADGGYDGVSVPDVAVTVDDDETVSIVLSKTDLTVEEEDATGGTYTVKLSHEPSVEVTVTVTGQDTTDLTLSGLSGTDTLTFSTTTWDDAQTVTVKAGEDTDAANDKVTLTHAATGGEYEGVSSDLAVTVDDDETVSIVLSKTDLTVEEEDATGGTYTVKLSHEPSVEVTVTVTGQDTTDLTLSGLSGTDTLTFSTTTWDDAQTVTVKAGEDTDAANDKVTLTHAATGGEYEGVSSDLAVTVDDDETVSIVLSKTDLTVEEEDATGGTYTVKLSHEPSVEVTVTVTGQDTTDLTLSGLSGTDTLTFSTTTWDDAQTVTVKAGEDTDAANDKVTLTHAATGGEYEGVSSDLAVTVDDDETVSIVLSKTDLTVEEEDATGGTYTVKLSHEPSVEVTVTVTGQDTTDLTLSGLSGTDTLTFSTTTWDDAQTVTVKAGEDADAKNDSVTLTHAATGGEYEGVAEELAVTVDDDETLGVVISPTALTVQAGGSNSYTVALGSLPSGDVTVTLSGHEGAVLSLAGIDNGNALTFTQDNWHAPQTVSVSADAEAQSSTITIEHSVASADDPDYAAAAAPDVAVSVLGAPDTIQIQVGVATSVQELEVPEGGANTYSMVLSHQPSGDVTVTVNNPTDNSEVTATPRTLTFTTENWHAPQTVTVAAVHDGDAADDSATVTHGVADGGYDGVSVPDVAVTVDDDETLGVVISPTALTVQAGGSNSYTVALGSLPSGDVTVTLAGHEGAVLSLAGIDNDNALTFTQDNWHAPQTVSVSADAEAQSSTITIEHSVASADDPDYAAAAAPDVAVSVLGAPDTIEIQVGVATSVQELEVPEGGANTYSMVLSHQPSGDVTVTVNNPTDNSEVTATPRTLTFTTENWHAPQTVTVAAVHDGDAADDSATVTHGVADGGYDGVNVPDVAVTVTDDETLGVVISPTAIAVQAGGSNSYTVALGSLPSGDVTVTLSGHEGAVLSLAGIDNGNALTFTQDNWHAPQTVSVSADAEAQSSTITIEHSVASADDPDYAAAAAPDVAVSVLEAPDTIQIQVGVATSVQELEVPEGGANTYSMVLSHQPSGDVTVTVNNPTDNSEVTATPRSLTFTQENWHAPQTVTVSAAHDGDAADDSATVTHGVADGGYDGVSVPDVAVTVDDDETVSIVLSETTLTVVEGDSTGQTYTVKLSHQPSREVTVTVTGQDTTDLTLSGLSGTDTLTFDATTWDDAQTVTVKAREDTDAANDSITLTHTGAGGEYEGVKADLPVTVDDDETVSIVLSETTLTVVEGDSTGQTYTVELSHAPSVEVTVTVTGQDQTDLTLSGLSGTDTLSFTTSTWDDAQTVTVKAREDTDAANDSITLTHTGAGGEYEGVKADLPVTVDDDETVSIVLSETTLTVVEGDSTGQTYTVKLSHQPSREVTVTVTGQDTTDLTLSGLSGTDTLTFDATTWDDAQTVTVKAREDTDAANDSITLTHTGAGGEYEGVKADLPVTVDDDETLGVVISPTAIAVQAGGSNSYTVVLGSLPSGDVTVTLAGHEGAVLSLAGIDNGNALTFTQDNWHAPQTVSVSADAEAQSSTITIGHSVSSADDPDYAGATAADVGVSVLEAPDTIQIQVGVATSVQELEVPEGGSNTYSMVLSHQPSGDVTVTVNNPTDNSEVTATPRSLTFTQENWHAPQTVTVSAAHDGDAADDSATVTHGVADGGYDGVSVPDVAVTVDDDETVSIVLSETTLTVVEGDSTGQTYTVKLSHQPSREVTVTVTGQDTTDLTLSGLSGTDTLTFDATTWDDAQTVTVKAREDTDAANDSITLTHTGAGGEYEGVKADLPVTVDDDDSIDQAPSLESVRVRFTNAATAIPEGSTVTVVVSLTEALTQDVTIPLTRTNQAGAGDADYSGVPASLAFGSGDTQQSFTFSATVDSEDEDEEQVVLGFGTLPEGVAQGTVSQATITILDVPSVSFGASDYSATEGGEDAMVTVQLSEALAADLTVPLTAEGGGGATPEDWSGVPSEVTFSAGDTSKTFTVVAVDDTVEDDDEMVHLGFGSLPSGFNAGPIASATVTLMNDEVMDSCVGSKIWCATITLEGWITDPPYETYHIAVWDRGLPEWAETEREFTYGGVTYAVSAVLLNPDPLPNEAHRSTFRLSFREDHIYNPPSEDHIAQWRLQVGDIQLEFEDAIARLGDGDYIWAGAGFRPISKGGTNLTLRIESTEENTQEYTPVASNSRPTGELMVTGEARVGSTLTMDASGISDPDGRVHSDFRYTWWVVYASYSGSNHRDDGTMYTVEPELEGLRIQGRVTFTDDAGNREAVMSAMTPIICAADGEIEPCEATVPQDVGNAPPENSPATGKPAITGAAEVGETLTASTGALADPDGLTPATFSYQWARDDGSASTDISDATASTYTLQKEDLDRQVSVTVSFTDEAGYQEMLTSDSVYVQLPSPLYGGFDSTTLPSEHEGSNTFTFEIHFSEEPVLGFEAVREYVLDVTNGDVTSVRRTTQGSNIRWEITVQPDGNDEVILVLPITTDCDDQGAVCTSSEKMLSNKSSVTIAGPPETAQQVQPENSPATSAPTIGGSAQVGETLTADTSGIADADGLTNATFSFQWVAGGSDISGATGSTYTLTASDQGQTVQVRVSFTDDAGNEETLTSVATASVAARPNSLATGAPTISGTVRVGETVAAGTTGIADADGLDNASFSYQWVRSEGGVDTDIGGATSATYELQAAEQGHPVKVRVSFTDDAGNEETTTSAASAAVSATFPGTPRSLQVQTGGTGELAVTWQEPESNGGSEVTGYRVQWKLATGSWNTEADVSSATATGTSYTIGSLLLDTEYTVRVIATNGVGDGPPSAERTETAQAQTSEQQDSTPDTAATGAPTISGTAQVGQTLSAHTSDISDADGLANVSFSYQWLADGTEISGAAGSAYTLVDADEGKVIRVRASFTDDDSNDESLTSEGTASVEPKPNTPATGAPTISGAVQVGQTLTADTSGIADADGLDNAAFSYRWTRSGLDITSATGSTYTVHNDDSGQDLRVRVSFTDDDGFEESLTSDPAAVPLPTPLTGAFDESAVPDSHDGSNAFTLEFFFSKEPSLEESAVRDQVLTVVNGTVTSASRTTQGSALRWEITVQPDGDDEVTVTLPRTTDCGDPGAVCTQHGQVLSKDFSTTVSGPEPQQQQQEEEEGEEEEQEQGPTEPPPAPTDLTGTINDDGSITLSWTAPEDDTVTGYQILRRRPKWQETELEVYVDDTGSRETSYRDTNTSEYTRYVYRVKARNAAGLSGWSNFVRLDKE